MSSLVFSSTFLPFPLTSLSFPATPLHFPTLHSPPLHPRTPPSLDCRKKSLVLILIIATTHCRTLQLSLTALILNVQQSHLHERAPFFFVPSVQDHASSIIQVNLLCRVSFLPSQARPSDAMRAGQEFEFGRIGAEGVTIAVGEVQQDAGSSARKVTPHKGRRLLAAFAS